MDIKELKKENARLIRNAKNRIKNLNEFEEASPAIKSLIEHGTPLYTKGLNDKELKKQNKDLKYFLNLKTSTVRGYREYISTAKDIFDRIEEFDEETKSKFFKVYNELVGDNALFSFYKYETFEKILNNMEEDDDVSKIKEKIENLYEEAEERHSEVEMRGVFDM